MFQEINEHRKNKKLLQIIQKNQQIITAEGVQTVNNSKKNGIIITKLASQLHLFIILLRWLVLVLKTILQAGRPSHEDAPRGIQGLIVSLDYLGKTYQTHWSLNAGRATIQDIGDQSSHIGHIKDSIAIHITT